MALVCRPAWCANDDEPTFLRLGIEFRWQTRYLDGQLLTVGSAQ